MRLNPPLAAWMLTTLLAIAIAASVFRIPIQVSDSLEILEQVDAASSVPAAFTQGLHASRTMLRPLRQTQTKILLDLAHALGDRYNLVFRGFHAAGAGLLIVLFTAAARPRAWIEVAALAFALTVLTGLHTFDGMLREAYPVNHFLLIAIYGMATLVLAQSRPSTLLGAPRAKSRGAAGIGADFAACACFALASLTLESGLVVWAIAAAGYAAGLRGISRRALIAMTALVAGYMFLRVGYLHMIGNAVGERQTGFGAEMLSTDQLRARFGGASWVLYGYTVACSALTVLLSQPVAGQWTLLHAWQVDDLQPFYANQIGTSLAATALAAWYLFGRAQPGGPRRWRQPVPLVAMASLATSALLSYAYAKSEIMSTAGVLYALVVFLAARAAIERMMAPDVKPRLVTLALVALVSGGWGFRALGVQYQLQRAAFAARSEWVMRLPPYGRSPVAEDTARLLPRLRDEALRRGRTSPFLLWPRLPRLWGED